MIIFWLIFAMLLQALVVVLWIRNNLVCEFRVKILEEDSLKSRDIVKDLSIEEFNEKYKNRKHLHPRYHSLPNYHWMVLQIWVWPISKFLKEK